MALQFEERRPIRWFRIISFALILTGICFATYFLFFAPSPKFEYFLPKPLEDANAVSNIEFIDPTLVIQSPGFRVLQDYAGPLGVGRNGRPNPFLPL